MVQRVREHCGAEIVGGQAFRWHIGGPGRCPPERLLENVYKAGGMVIIEVVVEQRINKLEAWKCQSTVCSPECSSRVQKTGCFAILGRGASVEWS